MFFFFASPPVLNLSRFTEEGWGISVRSIYMGNRVCCGSKDDRLVTNNERNVLVCWLVFYLVVWPTVFECLARYCSKIRRNLGLVRRHSSVFRPLSM